MLLSECVSHTWSIWETFTPVAVVAAVGIRGSTYARHPHFTNRGEL
jgi:hypothetical protein